MKLAALLFLMAFLGVHSFSDFCPANECKFGKTQQCVAWTSFTSNKAVFNPALPTEGPLILGCNVCEELGTDLAMCTYCKNGLVFKASTGHNIFTNGAGMKFQCEAAGCSVTNCATCASDPASCDDCEKGYYLVVGTPNSCSACPPKCSACVSATKCTECKARNVV